MLSRTAARMSRSFAPLGDRVLVKRAMQETKTAGGIFLPGDEKAANEGTVSAVGPGLPTETGAVIPMNVKVGDKVLLPEYGGMKVEIGDDEMFLYREHDILGTFS